jgi:hypothetical protein
MTTGAPGSVGEIRNAAVFAELVGPGDGDMFDMLSSPAQTQGMVERMLTHRSDFQERSDANHPIVRITDLQTKPGDEVSVDMLLAKYIRPLMGDERVEGRYGTTSFASDKLKINQFVFPWDSGGNMSQKRTRYKLRPLSRAQAMMNARAYLNQLKQVHLAGARGDDASDDWIIPLENDPDINKLLINPLRRPTHNRVMCANGKQSIADLTTEDFLKLDDITRLDAKNRGSRNPVRRIILPNDPAARTEPLGIALVDYRVWYYIKTYHSGTRNDWRSFMMGARERGGTNPLFAGSLGGMIDGWLIKVMPRRIAFNQGTTIKVASSDAAYAETTVTVPTFDATAADPADHAVSCSIFMGAEALAELWAGDGEGGQPTDWYEGTENHGRQWVCSLAGKAGIGKIRFKASNGEDTDRGVWAVYSYAPDPDKVPSLS